MTEVGKHPHGNKTNQQNRNIIENRIDTSNAPDDFDIRADLVRSDADKRAAQDGDKLRTGHPDFENADDRAMLRGEHQESRHHKNRPDEV